MASSSKKKTTMAKINRENAVRERRLKKQARKVERKQAAADELAAAERGETLVDEEASDDAVESPEETPAPTS